MRNYLQSGVLVRERVPEWTLKCNDKHRTIQSEKENCKPSVVISRWLKTGVPPDSIRMPSYGDYGDKIFDFHTAQNVLVDAKRAFMQLPAHVRKRFSHDPQEFLEFCEKEKDNIDELRKLGLAVPKVEEKPDVASSKTATETVAEGAAK